MPRLQGVSTGSLLTAWDPGSSSSTLRRASRSPTPKAEKPVAASFNDAQSLVSTLNAERIKLSIKPGKDPDARELAIGREQHRRVVLSQDSHIRAIKKVEDPPGTSRGGAHLIRSQSRRLNGKVPMNLHEGQLCGGGFTPAQPCLSRRATLFLELDKRQHRSKTDSDVKGKVLDGFLILEEAGVDDPADVTDVFLNCRNITSVLTQDLSFYIHLRRVELGDNRVQINDMVMLRCLRELHLYCNGIVSYEYEQDTFPELEVLNLAYNALSVQSVEELSKLPCLRELDLSYNSLSALPRDLSEFQSLEALSLDRNHLCRDSSIVALSTIPRLQYLSLRGNLLKKIPQAASEDGGFALLQFLDVSENLIETEAALYAVFRLQSLTDLCIAINPLVQSQSGESSTIQVVPYLHQRLVQEKQIQLVISEEKCLERPPLAKPVLQVDDPLLAPSRAKVIKRKAQFSSAYRQGFLSYMQSHSANTDSRPVSQNRPWTPDVSIPPIVMQPVPRPVGGGGTRRSAMAVLRYLLQHPTLPDPQLR
mmetsp:Transcript_21790/g.36042  ORF Transcript_21790/g.36042 Transcript_21790/m.36042 type:complete len:535 (-) Transcript_21790:643-2247(-)|eukprot:CAMPEP_0184660280 /NCGR_PEP_ID=MMETSP0308-20130426/33275_1 /TAXON_ID=38269 /ORGANISM="Gloeochaete witrockiana, Strain SAG 46.84" /LENGTH=534 /DNA_ID=CAMNT_0027100757 /DNA_START=80 /DNA_END=1684 /DNA_ORIENTATION=+